MALSGSLSKFSAYDGTHQHWIDWTATQSISGNYSDVTMNFKSDFSSAFGVYSTPAGDNKIRFNGTNYDGVKFNGSPGTHTQFSITKRVYHNSDGTGSFILGGVHRYSKSPSADYKYWSDVTQTLDKIPRASTLSSFSMGASLKVGTANSINLGLSRASTSFRHHIYLMHGSTEIARWTNEAVPTSLALTATEVNTLLRRLSTVTSATMTLRVQTISGVNGSAIGGVLSRTATATISSTVIPTATTPSVSIYGSGHDKTIGKYVQNISRVTASFTASAGYGANITSSKISVTRISDEGDGQTITGASGTTAKAVRLSGAYRVRALVTDSRGREYTGAYRDITVHAYSPPKITSFSASRDVSNPTKINYSRVGSWSHLAGDNTANIKVEYRAIGWSWQTVESLTGTDGTVSKSVTITGSDVTKSYELKLTVTDQFGKSASSTQTVSTQKVVLDIHKDEGIGIGKVHEHGALDVQGSVYFDGVKVDLPKMEAHLAENASKHIKESGSNVNGKYIKFDDGTMICWARRNLGNADATNGQVYDQWYYPKAFISIPTVTFTPEMITSGSGNALRVRFGMATLQTDFARAGIENNTSSQRQFYANWHAIGRWK